MERSLTLLDSGVIDFRTIDKLLQAVVFFADSVAIRATYEIAAADSDLSKEIDTTVRTLRELGLLRLWAHEYEVDDAGTARNPRAPGSPTRPADLVVAKADLALSLSEVDEVLRGIRGEAYRDVMEGRRKYRQGTAEIVSLRNQLASLVISSELKQDGLLTNPAARSTLASGVPAGETFRSAVVKDVIATLQLGSLTQLSPDQILECRRYSADFRKLLDNSLLSVARGLDPVLTPEATAREVVARYKEISTQYALPAKLGHQIGDEILWDVMGAGLPASVFLKYGIKAFAWRKAASELRPYLLLMHLERAVRTRPVR